MTVEEIFLPHAEVIGDVGPSLVLLADRFQGKLKSAGALLPFRGTESRFPLTPQRIVHDVREVMPEDGFFWLDNGMSKIWFARNATTAPI